MTDDTDKRHRKDPGPDHPITIEPGNDRVVATAAGTTVAATTSHLVLRESGYRPVHYLPREHAAPEMLTRSDTVTWCPYKGEAQYYHVGTGETRIEDAAWSYEDPFPAVAPIRQALAFDPQRIEVTIAPLVSPPAQAAELLHFWFTELEPEQHFRRSDDLDHLIDERYRGLYARGCRGELDFWSASATGTLALTLLLDQFSRNLNRGSGQAFAQDGKALALVREAVARGQDLEYTGMRRAFFYMPFMHAEELAAQEQCVALFENRLPGTDYIKYAREHRDIIARFGRFPHRNRMLGRQTTPEEQAFMDEGGASFA